MKEYIVIAKDEPAIDSIHAELTANTAHSNAVDGTIIPPRPVAVANERLGNPRITHYYLTDDEAMKLANDPRVEDIHLVPCAGSKIKLVTQRSFSYNNILGNFNRNTLLDKFNINWGLRRTSLTSAENRIGNTYDYDSSGNGVDIVIMDDGLQWDHPEFTDETGVTRVQLIDWYSATGIPGKMPPDHYKSPQLSTVTGDGEHGTHVATIAAGKTFGYAKHARIYFIKVFGNQQQAIPDSDQFDLIRVWHTKKPINPLTRVKRPTIVITSWGYSWFYSNSSSHSTRPIINSVNYRNRIYNYSKNPIVPRFQFGQIAYGQSTRDRAVFYTGRHGIVVPSVNAEQQEAEDAGVIFVHAAGNYSHKIDKTGGVDWNNYYTTNELWAGLVLPGRPIYYHRGSSPFSKNSINVSAASDSVRAVRGRNLEIIAPYSERGPGCDVVAPGSNITAGVSKTSTYLTEEYVWGKNNPADRSHKIAKISGTSMAAPQVAGVLALYLSRNPNTTPAQAKAWVAKIGIKNQILTSSLNNEWANPNALLGGPNNYLYNPYRNRYRDPK
jgi:subtilisin family serine protease